MTTKKKPNKPNQTNKMPKAKKANVYRAQGSNLRIYCYGLFNKVRHLSNTTKVSALNHRYILLPKCLASC